MKRLLLSLLFLPCLLNAQKHQIDSLLAQQKNMSAVVLVADKGKVIYHKAIGYRSFADNITLQKTDVFEMASVSKQFTAMIIMMLQEKHLLSYDDELNKSRSIDLRCPDFNDKAVPPTNVKSFSSARLISLFNKSRVAGSTISVCNI